MIRRLLATILAAAALTACGGVDVPQFTTANASPTSAAVALDQLQIKGRAPMKGGPLGDYSRAQFGKGWADPDGNGCDARRDVLGRQAVGQAVRRGKTNCIFSADILDPYTGKVIPSTTADVDHLVALGDAWQKGAQQLSAAQREALANDPMNLLAVDASLNRSKGDGDAATWLPPLKSERCSYVATQIAVKRKYVLSVTQAEHDAMAGVLATCPGQELPR